MFGVAGGSVRILEAGLGVRSTLASVPSPKSTVISIIGLAGPGWYALMSRRRVCEGLTGSIGGRRDACHEATSIEDLMKTIAKLLVILIVCGATCSVAALAQRPRLQAEAEPFTAG